MGGRRPGRENGGLLLLHPPALPPDPAGDPSGPGRVRPPGAAGPGGGRRRRVPGQPENRHSLGAEGRGRGIPAGPGPARGARRRPPHRHPLFQPDEGQRKRGGPPPGGQRPAGHGPPADAPPAQRGGRGAVRGPGDRPVGDFPVHSPLSRAVPPVAHPPGAGRDSGRAPPLPLLLQRQRGGGGPGHRGGPAGALPGLREALPRIAGGPRAPPQAHGGPAPQGPGLLHGAGAAGGPAGFGGGPLRLPLPELRGQDGPLYSGCQKAPLPHRRAAGGRADLLPHRRRPLPHLPLRREAPH